MFVGGFEFSPTTVIHRQGFADIDEPFAFVDVIHTDLEHGIVVEFFTVEFIAFSVRVVIADIFSVVFSADLGFVNEVDEFFS